MYSAQSFQSAECTLPWFIVVRLPTTYKLPLSASVQSLLEILHWTGYSPVQCTISVLHTYSSCHVLIKVGIFIHIFSCEVAHHHFLWIDYSQNLKAAQAHVQHLLTFFFLSWFQYFGGAYRTYQARISLPDKSSFNWDPAVWPSPPLLSLCFLVSVP